MKQILKLVFLLVIGQTAFGQAPSNYVNINGRYRWIAGMFDSTFHIPKGSTPSLRTGGSTNSGGLFYNTSDSSVYTYTGTQWIKLRGVIIDTTSLSNRINLKLNISDTAAMLAPYLRKVDTASLSNRINLKLNISDTASMLNPYLRKIDTTNKYVTQVYKKNASDSVFYVKGGNHIWAFNDSTGSPGGGGGGKVYYFNGGVSMGTISGLQMYELGDTANTGTAANFTRATTGNIANFITDPGKPGLVQIPAGVWSVDAWLSETGGGSNHAEIWIEVEKWDGSTITTIATSPIEQITEGATPNLYSWSVTIPTTTLAITDRIIIQFYISNTNGKTVTLYTQNAYVGEVHTTFTTGIGAINGLTAPAQYLVTGTSGTDFNINSATATHTFNLPTASATNRGALSTTDWTTFNSKLSPADTVSLSNRINLKLNISDTASMLSPYARTNAVNAGLATKVNISDTSTMLSPYARKNFLNAGTGISYSSTTGTIANTAPDQTVALNAGTGISISGTYPNFTITNSSPSSGGTVTSVGSNTGTGLTGGPITTSGTLAIDTLLISTRAWRQKGIDSVQANLTAGLATKLNISDTASMLSPYARTNVVNAGLALKVNISDTASMLTPYLRKIDTTSMLSPYLRSNVAAATYVPQTRTITINGTSQDLTANRTYNVGTVTSVGITAGTGISVANSPVTGSGNITVTNTAPDQTVSLSAGTGISIAGTYPSFTITNSSPSSGGTVTSVGSNSGTGLTGGPITGSGTLAIDTALISTRLWRQKGVDSVAALANTKVSSVSGTAPISSSGGTSPTISISQASGSTNGFLSSTDWTTFNNKQNALTNPVTGTGTTNYIPKFTSSSAIGNSQIFDNGSNVGINIASPAAMLDVNGAGLIRGFLTTTDAIKLGANTSAPTSTDAFIYRPADNTLAFGTASSERLRISSTGNVSIGNTNNTYKLDVTGDARINNLLWFTPSSGLMALGANGTNFEIYNGAGAETRLTLTNSGNLGLGTSNPASNLQVAAASSPTIAMSLTGSATSGSRGDLSWYNSSISTVAIIRATAVTDNVGTQLEFHTRPAAGSLTQRMTLDASGNLGLGVTPSAWSLLTGLQVKNASIAGYGNNTYIFSNAYYDGSNSRYISNGYASYTEQSSGQHIWYTAPSGTAGNAITFTQAMTLDASGRLGIGTSAPAEKLDVYDNSASNVSIKVGNTSGALQLLQGNGAAYLYTATNQPLIFSNNNSEKMRLDASGNLGIGTSSPTSKLQSNNASTYNSSTPSGAIVASNLSNGNAIIDIGVDATYLGYIQSRNLTNTTSYNLLLNPLAGNVGIGTTSPSNKLTVNGTNIGIDIQNSGTTYFRTELDGGNTTYLSTIGAYDMILRTNSTERMRITSGGNLLVGTTTDIGDKMYVNGSIRIPSATFFRYDGDVGLIGSGSSVSGGTVSQLGIRAASDILFATNGANERMRITSGGNVGIGTSSPTEGKLVVANSGPSIIYNKETSVGVNSFWNASDGSIVQFGVVSNHPLIMLTNNTERMRITSGGEVLINTTSDAGDYKLQVNGNGLFTGRLLVNNAADDADIAMTIKAPSGVGKYIMFGRDASDIAKFTLSSSGDIVTGGSIKTAAPSAGNAAAWKLGERVASAGVTFNDQQYIQLDIAGTTYYLATVDLPMPEAYPQATSGPSNNYKITPVQVKTTRDAEIEKLRKEIEELKQLIKNK
jgi:hypothetical protein